MEKLRNHGGLAVKRRDFVASTALAGVMIVGQATFSSEGRESFEYKQIPEDKFTQVVIPKETPKTLPYSDVIVEFPKPLKTEEKPLSKTEQKVANYRKESNRILNLAINSEKFSKNQIKDWKTYGPIYIAAGKATGVNPINLWVTHEAESGASAKDSDAFSKDSYYIGGMQLSPQIYNTYKDRPLVKDLGKILKKEFKVRHKGDIENIIIASLYIGANEDTIKHSNVRSEKKGFIRFVGSESAGLFRYKEAKKREEIIKKEQIKESRRNQEIMLSEFRNK